MLRVFLVLVLLILSFVGGVTFERLSPGEEGSLKQRILELEEQSDALNLKNQQLNDTLQLVKRQIQTDRIAYQALQQAVEDSEMSRVTLKEQLESQRDLLKKLRARLESE